MKTQLENSERGALRPFNRLASWEVDSARANPARASEYGTPEIITATGRARCRSCGEKITKGQQALKFFYDFSACGSWTAIEVQIHLRPEDCATV